MLVSIIKKYFRSGMSDFDKITRGDRFRKKLNEEWFAELWQTALVAKITPTEFEDLCIKYKVIRVNTDDLYILMNKVDMTQPDDVRKLRTFYNETILARFENADRAFGLAREELSGIIAAQETSLSQSLHLKCAAVGNNTTAAKEAADAAAKEAADAAAKEAADAAAKEAADAATKEATDAATKEAADAAAKEAADAAAATATDAAAAAAAADATAKEAADKEADAFAAKEVAAKEVYRRALVESGSNKHDEWFCLIVYLMLDLVGKITVESLKAKFNEVKVDTVCSKADEFDKLAETYITQLKDSKKLKKFKGSDFVVYFNEIVRKLEIAWDIACPGRERDHHPHWLRFILATRINKRKNL